MKYFSLNRSFEDNKAIYYEKANLLHPDKKNGNDVLFKELKTSWEHYNIIYENLVWIKQELKHETKTITIPKPIYVDRIVEKKIIDKEILTGGVALAKQINKLLKNLSKE